MTLNTSCKLEIPNIPAQQNHLQLEKEENTYEGIWVDDENLCLLSTIWGTLMNLSLEIAHRDSEETTLMMNTDWQKCFGVWSHTLYKPVRLLVGWRPKSKKRLEGPRPCVHKQNISLTNFELMPVLIPRVFVMLKAICVMPHQYAVLQVLHKIAYLLLTTSFREIQQVHCI